MKPQVPDFVSVISRQPKEELYCETRTGESQKECCKSCISKNNVSDILITCILCIFACAIVVCFAVVCDPALDCNSNDRLIIFNPPKACTISKACLW